ncbi:hypothetical protein PI125_g12470 [Phytophthora idaei]|nr:hypothetical protein PI125_g12470 [Phytophthora idaei]KAG3139816.1 hypothetical protein PI126_g16294 [Phytophthora idaei]
MEVNAEFVDAVYETVKADEVYLEHFSGKTIVIVLDNAPAHNQTEAHVTEREDLELLRLGPYSPMCCNGVTRKWLRVATWLHGGFSNVGVRHTNGYTLQTAGLYAFRLPIGR